MLFLAGLFTCPIFLSTSELTDCPPPTKGMSAIGPLLHYRPSLKTSFRHLTWPPLYVTVGEKVRSFYTFFIHVVFVSPSFCITAIHLAAIHLKCTINRQLVCVFVIICTVLSARHWECAPRKWWEIGVCDGNKG